MKVIANIPEDMLQELKDGCFGAKHTLYDLAGAICNAVTLPDNATNGDVIKALFPDCERESRLNEECIEVMGAYRVVDRSWWDAPYKGGQEDGKA